MVGIAGRGRGGLGLVDSEIVNLELGESVGGEVCRSALAGIPRIVQ